MNSRMNLSISTIPKSNAQIFKLAQSLPTFTDAQMKEVSRFFSKPIPTVAECEIKIKVQSLPKTTDELQANRARATMNLKEEINSKITSLRVNFR